MASGHFRPPPEVGGRSYFPSSNSNLMSDGMRRARKPYLRGNLIIGGVLVSFGIGTYFYVRSSLQQEDFSDVQSIPREVRQKTKSIEDEMIESASSKLSSASSSLSASSKSTTTTTNTSQESTISSNTSSSSAPSPISYSLFWSSFLATGFGGKDAPPVVVLRAPGVDNLGKLGDRSSDYSAKRLV